MSFGKTRNLLYRYQRRVKGGIFKLRTLNLLQKWRGKYRSVLTQSIFLVDKRLKIVRTRNVSYWPKRRLWSEQYNVKQVNQRKHFFVLSFSEIILNRFPHYCFFADIKLALDLHGRLKSSGLILKVVRYNHLFSLNTCIKLLLF